MENGLKFRPIEYADIPALFAVRTATDENNLSREELTAIGITEESVGEKLRGSCRGWLCEAGREVVGFAIGDSNTGELWVIAVLPAFIRQGIGSRLLTLVEEWLRSCGCGELWLTTDVDTRLRAYSFYLKHGWEDDRIEGDLRYMKKRAAARNEAKRESAS